MQSRVWRPSKQFKTPVNYGWLDSFIGYVATWLWFLVQSHNFIRFGIHSMNSEIVNDKHGLPDIHEWVQIKKKRNTFQKSETIRFINKKRLEPRNWVVAQKIQKARCTSHSLATKQKEEEKKNLKQVVTNFAHQWSSLMIAWVTLGDNIWIRTSVKLPDTSLC